MDIYICVDYYLMRMLFIHKFTFTPHWHMHFVVWLYAFFVPPFYLVLSHERSSALITNTSSLKSNRENGKKREFISQRCCCCVLVLLGVQHSSTLFISLIYVYIAKTIHHYLCKVCTRKTKPRHRPLSSQMMDNN